MNLATAIVGAVMFALGAGQAGAQSVSSHTAAAWTVPRDALPVSTTAALTAALEGHVRDIVLEDGSYGAGRAIWSDNGARLYARHPGAVVFTSGIGMKGRGGVLAGVAFAATARSDTVAGALVDVWGDARDTKLLDLRMNGGGRVHVGVRVSAPDGLVARRIVARRFTDAGIAIGTYPRHVRMAVQPQLTDIDVAHVARRVPRSSQGTAEACLWLATAVRLDGAHLRDCAWDGLWTGFDSTGSRITNVDIDQTPVGIYAEHFSTSSTFSGIHVGPNVRVGLNCEWADPAYGRRPGCTGVTVERSMFESSQTGVYLDEGTTRTTIRDSSFRNQVFAGIVDYRGHGNAYSHNDFGGLHAGAVPIRTASS